MKIPVTFLFLLTLSTVGAQKPLYVIWHDDQDRLYAQTWDQKERSIYFYPYLVNQPFEDSASNLYRSRDVIDLYHQQPPPNIGRKLDPAEIRPVTTKEMPNTFVFFIDLRSMTQAEQDSCQSFMRYFYDHLAKGEEVRFVRMSKDNSVHNSLIYPQPYYPYAFPLLNDRDTLLWHSTFDQMGRVSYTNMFRTMNGVIESNDSDFTYISEGVSRQSIVIYVGKSGELGLEKEKLLQLNTKYRKMNEYMHYIDLSEENTDSLFRQTAKIGGGAAMKFKWGKEALTQTIMNDLVVYYFWEEKKTEEPYNPSQAETYPAPKAPQPARPSFPLPSKRPVILEPVKKPKPVLRN